MRNARTSIYTCAALFVVAALSTSACTQQMESEAIDVAAEKRAIDETLTTLHDAATNADFERYFGVFADDGVFLGTDATERWTVAEFREYARPRFEDGGGWEYHMKERYIYLAPDGRTAWFDETLENANLGDTRGSGALLRTDDGWKITQYNLTIPIPNDLARQVVGMIREMPESEGP